MSAQHEPKEPRRAPTPEEGCVVCTQPTTGNALCNACWESYKEGYAGSTLDAICWAAKRVRQTLTPERPTDPRIEAWRGLDAKTRAKVLANLRQDWPPYDARDHAAAALEALGEK